ncbi:MAG: HAD-IC family P-type ATPase [Chromatiaceae bacterium]|jgi:Ca2+-transporting ATPase
MVSTALITPIHTRVPGRARLEVQGLYHSAALKRRLESALTAAPEIRQIEANTRTGRVLVVFDAEVALAAVCALIEAQLQAPGRRSLPNRTLGRRSPIRRFDVAPVLQGLAAALRTLPSVLQSRPVLGATSATAAAAAVDDPVAQAIHPWHLMKLEAVLEGLEAVAVGLSQAEAQERLRRYGENALRAAERRSDLAIFLEQFNSLPVWLLGVSAAISAATGGAADAAVILGVVLINAAIGFVTERQAEITITSLAKSGVTTVNVLRAGETYPVAVTEVVPGDVLVLAPGTYIAADIRLLKSHNLSVDESALTGESLPVAKDHDFLSAQDTALADRKNMAFMGTHVTGGSGRGVVVATAEATELGQIQTMVSEAEAPETPMERQLDSMGTQLALLSGGVCAGVFAVGLLRGYGWMEMLKSSVSLAVAAVPEGLPAVATTTLAMGISNMRKQNVSVRHLDAVESLGSVQVFCMDKTGTLTLNRMAVVAVYAGEQAYRVSAEQITADGTTIDPLQRSELVKLMQVVTLCSESELVGAPGEIALDGSPTENALVMMAIHAGIDVSTLRAEHPTLRTRYRAEGRPYMCTLHPYKNGKFLLAVKGSPDELLGLCEYQVRDGRKVRLSRQARTAISAENTRMAGDALRVLGVAYLEVDDSQMPRSLGKLVWLGLAGMADPMRPGMDELIAHYHRAGIETIMITGDQSGTAAAIGRQLGLSGDKPLKVLESSALEDLDPQLLAGLVKDVHVFARVSPAHKLQIVQALQAAGLVVAMTGDGINDGPALKAADVGVAMGGGGTNVARDVSDVVLEDDNLHTMTAAISQGRTIYNNIRKMIHFMVSTNLTEIEVMLAGIALNLGQPMNPMQLLWINLVTDIFPGLALSLEPAEPDIMYRTPRDPDEKIIENEDLRRMVFESGIIGVGTMAAYLYGLKRYGDPVTASTMAFNSLTLNELAHALSSRSKYRNVFGGQELTPNPHLVKAIGGMAALQAVVSIVPAARRVLGTAPLGLSDLLVLGGSVLLPLVVNEMTKPEAPTEEEESRDPDIDQAVTEGAT